MHLQSGLVSIQRFYELPIVRTGVNKATDIYVKVKTSNRLFRWSLDTAEVTVTIAYDISKPTIVLLDGPIHLIDEILCKSLDMVEDAVPIIKREPDQIYTEARNYVNAVMAPVLKRADSVKEISIQSALVVSNKAAESIDNVLDVAEEIVEKYLPEIKLDGRDISEADSSVLALEPAPRNATEKTIRHAEKLSRKFTRRLTQRTIYEARALKKQGVNTIQVLLQLTDLLARDPKAFVVKMKSVWVYLSEDEPENQEPPRNLEELIVMLTREGARRFVHVANFVSGTVIHVPDYANRFIHTALNQYNNYVQSLHLSSTGMKRQTQILTHAIHDIFDQFFILLKPFVCSGNEVTITYSYNQRRAIACKKSDEQHQQHQANGGASMIH